MSIGFKRWNWKSIVTVWVLALGLVTGVQLVKVNLDNRSKATDETDNIIFDSVSSEEGQLELCGNSDGLNVAARPVSDLCIDSSAVWIDSVAAEGVYKWYCVDGGGNTDECYAFLAD